ncbi:MAG: glutamine amidotransferase, partial [Nitrososphaerota archaeon]
MSIRVLYVGDSVTLIGPIFIASPFIMEIKEFNVSIVAKPLIDVFQKNPEINLRYMTSWDAYSQFPKTVEELKNYDVLILSDVDADTLYFYPEFYMPSEWGKTIAMPNRLKSIREFIKEGGGLI